MSGPITYSLLAVLLELNERESRRKLHMVPDELRYYAILAGAIVGAEISKRVAETPKAVVRESEAFVARLLGVTSPAEDGIFQGILETWLIETLRDELRFSCANCRKFKQCLDSDNLSVGELFRRRTEGEETAGLKAEITAQVTNALVATPYLDGDRAHMMCREFIHQYSASDLGVVVGRYSDIALTLQRDYGTDYRKLQQRMIEINMDFVAKCLEKTT